MELFTRDSFRNAVFGRDQHKCVVCGKTGPRLDAHHIMERRLFTEAHERGGYYLENGATLCDDGTPASCHLRAEMTLLSTDEIRLAAGISRVVLPEHLYPDKRYTKWGDTILTLDRRMRGELFTDASVQKVLAMGGVLDLYVPYYDYPRTYHLPWSGSVLAGTIGDDKVLSPDSGLAAFRGKRVVVTVKMDGQNATLYPDYMHARSTDFKSTKDWHWLQGFHSAIGWEIPAGWRVCCENLHSKVAVNEGAIHYRNLSQYVMAFSIWDDTNTCLSWDMTSEWMSLLDQIARDAGYERGFPTVPLLFDGQWDEHFEKEIVPTLYRPTHEGDEMEGYVIRVADSFHHSQFRHSVAKHVRAGHQPQHGQRQRGTIVPNELLSAVAS